MASPLIGTARQDRISQSERRLRRLLRARRGAQSRSICCTSSAIAMYEQRSRHAEPKGFLTTWPLPDDPFASPVLRLLAELSSLGSTRR
jgi:hypothetical protein